ncbi:subtilase-type protease inhibitor [Streptomyces sp. WAC08241]|uniref:subtilase-type protease inhibitor n=1 Tax=Streptomyces sp. WAC08241 TaxID=2487421 RepID=UPI000F7A76D3|nr:subtilase-type protease inhibitor [Streptomyces sp. WAC08241]RSS35063.1 serine protease [Streptomyces sp. WAC08241]
MLRRSAAISAATLLCLAGAAGTAEAGSTSLYAPSAVVLSVGKGTDSGAFTVLRAATLSCMPGPSGTHPAPKAACAELKAGFAGGGFEGLLASPNPDRACPQHFDPVTVTLDGVWEGTRTSWQYTFSNACVMGVTLNGGEAFAF